MTYRAVVCDLCNPFALLRHTSACALVRILQVSLYLYLPSKPPSNRIQQKFYKKKQACTNNQSHLCLHRGFLFPITGVPSGRPITAYGHIRVPLARHPPAIWAKPSACSHLIVGDFRPIAFWIFSIFIIKQFRRPKYVWFSRRYSNASATVYIITRCTKVKKIRRMPERLYCTVLYGTINTWCTRLGEYFRFAQP